MPGDLSLNLRSSVFMWLNYYYIQPSSRTRPRKRFAVLA